MDNTTSDFLFQHLFLPPDLPQVDHEELGADALLKRVSATAHIFATAVAPGIEKRYWTQLAKSTKIWIDLYASAFPSALIIDQSLRNMQIHGM